MIVRFQVVRKDTKAPIQGARIRMEHGESDGITSAAGVAEINTYWSGNLMYSVEASGYEKVSGTVQVPTAGSVSRGVELGALASPGLPAPAGEKIVGSVGTSCDILQKEMFGGLWFRYRNRYTGAGSSWDSEFWDAHGAASSEPGCFAPPPPPPKTADDVQKDVDILRGTLQGISSRIQDLIKGFEEMGKALVDLEARIKAWIEEQIIAILLRALDREVEARGKNGRA